MMSKPSLEERLKAPFTTSDGSDDPLRASALSAVNAWLAQETEHLDVGEGYVPLPVFEKWRNRAAALFVVLGLVSAAVGWYVDDTRDTASDNLALEAVRSAEDVRLSTRSAALNNCQIGAENRIVTARAFDEFRRVLITFGRDPEAIRLFLERSQPPVDDLLTRAARQAYHAPGDGRVTERVEREVREIAAKDCERRATSDYGSAERAEVTR